MDKNNRLLFFYHLVVWLVFGFSILPVFIIITIIIWVCVKEIMKYELSSKVASILLNIDSSRVRQPSLHTREKGYTEEWGVTYDSDDYGEEEMKEHDNLQAQNQTTKKNKADTEASLLLLTQHRIAYHEQLLLRISNIPHIVLNSPFVCTECTGPLPYLTDLTSMRTSTSTDNNSKKEKTKYLALVGRTHPSFDVHLTTESIILSDEEKAHDSDGEESTINKSPSFSYDGSDIATYLKLSKHHDLDLDKNLNKIQKANSYLYKSLILEKLNPNLVMLRHDNNGRKQDSNFFVHNKNIFISFLKSPFMCFQSWAVRQVELRDSQFALMNSSNVNTNNASDSKLYGSGGTTGGNNNTIATKLKIAEDAYLTLENVLQSHQSSRITGIEEEKQEVLDQTLYLLKTNEPTTVDVLLFAHIAEAVLDPFLLHILSLKCPALISHFKNLYNTYFIDSSSNNRLNQQQEEGPTWWIAHNNKVNHENMFNPKWDATTRPPVHKNLPLLFDLMKEHVSLLDLDTIGKNFSPDDNNASKAHCFSAFHRLRHGGNFETNDSPSSKLFSSDIEEEEYQNHTKEIMSNYFNGKYFDLFFSDFLKRRNEQRFRVSFFRNENNKNENDNDESKGKSNAQKEQQRAAKNWEKKQIEKSQQEDQKWFRLVAFSTALVIVLSSTSVGGTR